MFVAHILILILLYEKLHNLYYTLCQSTQSHILLHFVLVYSKSYFITLCVSLLKVLFYYTLFSLLKLIFYYTFVSLLEVIFYYTLCQSTQSHILLHFVLVYSKSYFITLCLVYSKLYFITLCLVYSKLYFLLLKTRDCEFPVSSEVVFYHTAKSLLSFFVIFSCIC